MNSFITKYYFPISVILAAVILVFIGYGWLLENQEKNKLTNVKVDFINSMQQLRDKGVIGSNKIIEDIRLNDKATELTFYLTEELSDNSEVRASFLRVVTLTQDFVCIIMAKNEIEHPKRPNVKIVILNKSMGSYIN